MLFTDSTCPVGFKTSGILIDYVITTSDIYLLMLTGSGSNIFYRSISEVITYLATVKVRFIKLIYWTTCHRVPFYNY